MVSAIISPMTTTTRVSAIPGLARLWAETVGDPRISVAVLDGTIDRSHPCFDGAQLNSLPTLVSDVVGGGRMSAHATHIASTIFGQPGSPVEGVAPGCRGLIVPIFSDEKHGPTSQLDLARAINQAVEAGAHVINISGGELSNAGEADPMLVNAVRFCNEEGALIIAAAGNDACRCLHVPAALPSVLAVGALDARGVPLDSSNWGDVYQTQGILAPGQNIVGAAPGGGIALKTGTSFATPIVTGIVALMLSVQLARGQKPDPHAVREAILASAIPCNEELFADCERFLAGRLNIPGAYALISQTTRRAAMSDERIAGDRLPAYNAIQPGSTNGSSTIVQDETAKRQDAELQPSEVVDIAGHTSNGHSEAHGVTTAKAATPAAAEGATFDGIQSTHGARNHAATSPAKAGAVVASDCACQANGSKRFVFAIGSLGYDFGTEARRDGFRLLMPNYFAPEGSSDFIPYTLYRGAPPPEKAYPPNPYDARQLVKYLGGYPPPRPPYPIEGGFPRLVPPTFPPPAVPKEYPGYQAHLSEAAELIWILNIELTPIYAIRPVGNFSTEGYQRLVEFLTGQALHPDDPDFASRVSIPGVLTTDTVELFSGQVVPVIAPNLRGMYAWNENALITMVVEKIKAKREKELEEKLAKEPMSAAKKAELKAKEEADSVAAIAKAEVSLRNFLNRIYYDLRNLGQTSAERALNYTATNAFQAATVFADPASLGMQLDRIVTERSAFCRKDSDCWDVKLRFFDPENDRRARLVSRFTIDVSDAFPVSIGPVRTWSEPG